MRFSVFVEPYIPSLPLILNNNNHSRNKHPPTILPTPPLSTNINRRANHNIHFPPIKLIIPNPLQSCISRSVT